MNAVTWSGIWYVYRIRIFPVINGVYQR